MWADCKKLVINKLEPKYKVGTCLSVLITVFNSLATFFHGLILS